MIVGPTGTGKTKCYQILAATMKALKLIEKQKEDKNELLDDPELKYPINEQY